MTRGYPLYLALKFLRARTTSYLATLAIALSTAAVLVVLSVLWGLGEHFRRQARGINADLVVGNRSAYGITDYDALIAKIQANGKVRACAPLLRHFAFVKVGDRSDPRQILCIDPDREEPVTGASRWVEGGFRFRPDAEGEPPGIYVGRRLYDELGLSPGDRLTLMTVATSSPSVPIPSYPRFKERVYAVRGPFQSWDVITDRFAVLVGLDEGQRLLARHSPRAVSEIRISLVDPEAAPAVRRELEETLGFEHWVRPWQDINREWYAAQQAENFVMTIILSLILVSSGFAIWVILSNWVREKTRGIGILKSMGATRTGIAGIFVAAGATIGAVGGTLGVLLGWWFASNVNVIESWARESLGITFYFRDAYYLPEIPVHFTSGVVAYLWILAFAVSVLASLVPAWKAARLPAVEAMRYE